MAALGGLVARDLQRILDAESGDGVELVFTSPEGVTATIGGVSFDISQVFDPATGQLVSGRSVSVTAPIAKLIESGVGLPRGVANAYTAPFLVEMSNAIGATATFKVSSSNPDWTIGAVTMQLETYAL